ncbi:hypothetical protein E2C01_077629 [Portunus trituberculatus]|uniref:Uncharacterized protein n=1 Tax=Portunus trituberculatus TaxID=210409 RepID=A0A5B7IEY5_PORTR|nr:hypothetical protein [Portunus trituberculatus]
MLHHHHTLTATHRTTRQRMISTHHYPLYLPRTCTSTLSRAFTFPLRPYSCQAPSRYPLQYHISTVKRVNLSSTTSRDALVSRPFNPHRTSQGPHSMVGAGGSFFVILAQPDLLAQTSLTLAWR